MPSPLTVELGRFVANLRYEDIPAEARGYIASGLTDCAGVMIAGSGEDAVRILTATLSPPPGDLPLKSGCASAGWWAKANGT